MWSLKKKSAEKEDCQFFSQKFLRDRHYTYRILVLQSLKGDCKVNCVNGILMVWTEFQLQSLPSV